jgi:hypothetical protein
MPKFAEHTEQVALFRLLEKIPYRGGKLRDFCYAVPNGGTTGGRSALLAGARRKAEGVTAGVPDIECMIAVPPYSGLHIEMKKADGVPSDVSEAQHRMIDRLRSCGRKCEVAFGAAQAWKILAEYLDIKA